MKYISGTTDFKLHNSAVTLGKFDGIHLGHQMLLDKIVELKESGLTSVMFSFLYHPTNLFSEKEMNLIYTEEEKRFKLSKTNLDILVSYPFSMETANMEPEAFIQDILVQKMDAKVIVTGKDFGFGRGRRGDSKLLKELSGKYGYELIVYDKLKLGTNIVSSTLIRTEIEKGNMELVNQMLGSPYSIIGEVLHGRALGRTLGMPTVNQIPSSNKLLPPNGVYASLTYVDGKSYYSITNIGYKPTVGAAPVKGAETYIFDFEGDVYGKIVEVELFRFERPEERFESIELLKLQMGKDIEQVRHYFNSGAFRINTAF